MNTDKEIELLKLKLQVLEKEIELIKLKQTQKQDLNYPAYKTQSIPAIHNGGYGGSNALGIVKYINQFS